MGQAFGTGTHAEMPVAQTGASFQLGFSPFGISGKTCWSLPFIWLMAPGTGGVGAYHHRWNGYWPLWPSDGNASILYSPWLFSFSSWGWCFKEPQVRFMSPAANPGHRTGSLWPWRLPSWSTAISRARCCCQYRIYPVLSHHRFVFPTYPFRLPRRGRHAHDAPNFVFQLYPLQWRQWSWRIYHQYAGR